MKKGIPLAVLFVMVVLGCMGCDEKKETQQIGVRAKGPIQHGNKSIPQGALPPPGYKFSGQKP